MGPSVQFVSPNKGLTSKQAPKAGGCARDLTDQTAESS